MPPMSDATVSSEGWVFDTIPHYRLNDEIIDGFLSKKWPGYEFYIEVRPKIKYQHDDSDIL